MGTRGFVGFKIDGKTKGMYNHFDSYPEGLGKHVRDFCLQVPDWNALRATFDDVEVIDQDSTPTLAHQEMMKPFTNLNVSNQSPEDWYCLFRNLQGADILGALASGQISIIPDNEPFNDEYTYIIDFDGMELVGYDSQNEFYRHPLNDLPEMEMENSEGEL
jgi:hypothetical protein